MLIMGQQTVYLFIFLNDIPGYCLNPQSCFFNFFLEGILYHNIWGNELLDGGLRSLSAFILMESVPPSHDPLPSSQFTGFDNFWTSIRHSRLLFRCVWSAKNNRREECVSL